MNIENQVCTLEQAKRLQELGVFQRSTFYVWHQHGESPIFPKFSYGWDEADAVNAKYSAFNVAEMRIAIGIGHTVVQTGWRIYNGKTDPTYSVVRSAQLHDKGYYLDAPEVGRDNVDVWAGIGDEQPFTDGDAHGRLLIYLLENGLATADEVNQRLQNS